MKNSIKQKIGAWGAVLSVVGLVLSPAVVSAASDTDDTVVNANIAEVISVTTATPVALAITPTSGGSLTSNSHTVQVSTNNSTGYNLAVNDADATTTLANGASTLAASTGTKTAPIALVNNTWGVAVATATPGIGTNGFDATYSAETNATGSISKWAGMPASGTPMLLKSTTATATNDSTTVWYAAEVNTSVPDGTYTGTVTYTATTN